MVGVDSNSDPVTSNEYVVSVADLPQEEQFYYTLTDTFDPATIDVSTLTALEATTGTQTFSVGPSTAGQSFHLLVPSDHDIVTLDYTTGGIDTPELQGFTRQPNARILNGQQYVYYVRGPLTVGFNANVEITLS